LLRRKKFYVLYPEYFSSKLTRSQGRRVPLELADNQPHIKKLEMARKKLNLEFQVQKEKSYPTYWWNNSGRILITIDKKDKIPKEKLLKDIASIARKFKPKKRSTVEQVTKKAKKPINKKYGTARNVTAKKKKSKKVTKWNPKPI